MRQDLAIIIFTRYPVAGKAKTRLIPVLGKKGAAEFQRRLTEYTIFQANKVCELLGAGLIVSYHGGGPAAMTDWLGYGPEFFHQHGTDLGQNMSLSFEYAFAQQYRRVLLLGADIPGISPDIMAQAFQSLEKKELVLGPAQDGGYYLIGLQQASFTPELFYGVDWNGATVLKSTIAIAGEKKISYELVAKLSDIDTPKDLKTFKIRQADLYNQIIEDKNE